MWIKYVGAGLLVAICVTYCMQSNRHLRGTKQRLEAWITLLVHIRSHIACFGTPLREILERSAPTVLSVLALDAASENESGLAERCRADASILPGESGALMRSLADEVGTVWRREQIERLDYYISALEKEHQAYAARMSERLRLRNTLCVCGTLCVLLLIW